MKKDSLYDRIVFLFLSCVCVLGLIMVPFIRENSDTTIDRSNVEAFSQIGSWINQVAVTLSQDMLTEVTGSNIRYVDMMMTDANRQLLLNRGISEEQIMDECRQVETYLNEHYKEALNLGNLHALVMQNDSKKAIRRPQDNQLLRQEQLSDSYQFWICAVYDHHGVLNVTSNLNYGNSDFSPMSELKKEMEKYSFLGRYLQEPTIRDMTFVFGIPYNLESEDRISQLMNQSELQSYQMITGHVNVVLYSFVILGALILCGKKNHEKRLLKFLDSVALELRLVVIMICLAIMPFLAGKGGMILQQILAYNTNPWFALYQLLSYEMLFFMEIGALFFSVYWIISFFRDGWQETVKTMATRSFWKKCYVVAGKLWVAFKQWISDSLTVDFSCRPQGRLIRLMILNGVVLSALLLLLEDFYAAVVYSVVLYFVLMHGINRLNRDYRTLLDSLKKTAQGDLDVVVSEDLGVFEELKKELDDIRTGFRNAINDELKSQKMKNELISNVSHDLKTPLTSLISYIDLMKQEKDEKKRQEYLDVLQRNSFRLQHLIEDLFEVSKANSGDLKLELIDVDLVALISQTLFELNPLIEHNDLQMKLFYSHDKIVLPLDPQKTYRIVENLISNAAKYSLSGSRVYLRLIDRGRDVVLTLKNISKAEIDFDPNDLVERFVRGDKSRNSEGTGLGLAIAKGFAESQHARFSIQTDGDFFQVTIIFDREELEMLKQKTE